MGKPKIMLLGLIDQLVLWIYDSATSSNISISAKKEWESLSSIGDLIEPKAKNREEFIKECQSGAFDEVVAIYRTFVSVAITGLVDEELVAALPKNVKFLAHNGTNMRRLASGDKSWRSHIGAGYDQIDVHACTKHDIRVSNVPTAVDDATADANMFLILGALRGFNTCKLIQWSIELAINGYDYSIICCSRRQVQGQSCSTTWTWPPRKGPWYFGNVGITSEAYIMPADM